MSEHTPSPWEAVGSVVRTQRTVDGGGFLITDCPAGSSDRLANARLISAAPDLLAVCVELMESAMYWSDYDVPVAIVERLEAAIDKATKENVP